MDLADIIPYILTALGSGGVVGGMVKLWTDLRSGHRDDFRANIDAFERRAAAAEEAAAAAMTEAQRAREESRRAWRIVDRFLRAARACPNAATCRVLVIELEHYEDEDEEAAPVGVGR